MSPMRETLTLTTQEQTRLLVLNRVLTGQLTAAQAAELLQLSVRLVRRIIAAYRKEGAAALSHGNRGRRPAHALAPALRAQVAELARTRYAGCNDQHLAELLAEREGLSLSRSTVRRIRQAAGLSSTRTRRSPAHRRRRARQPQEGLLLQLDASPHAWLETRGPRFTLVAAIDDATGQVPSAHFRQQEDAHGYFQLLEQMVTTVGVPVAVYHDRHGIFLRSSREPETLAEQLAGRRALTQFGRLLAELGITSIAAHSPQAKGRVERLFGTFQDRLVSDLRLADARTLAEANRGLATFLPRFNARFAVPAAEPGRAYRPLPEGVDRQTLFCFT